MKKFIFSIFALFFSSVSWGAHVDPCIVYNNLNKNDDFLINNFYKAFVYQKFDPTVEAKIQTSAIRPTKVLIYPMYSWLEKNNATVNRPYANTLYNCNGIEIAFLVAEQCILSTDKIICAHQNSKYLKPYRLEDCYNEEIQRNDVSTNTVTEWRPRTKKDNDRFDSPKCPVFEANKCKPQMGKTEKESGCNANTYHICQVGDAEPRDCNTPEMLPQNAKTSTCTGKRNGYAVCVATTCNNGWQPQGGRCVQDKSKPEQITSSSTDNYGKCVSIPGDIPEKSQNYYIESNMSTQTGKSYFQCGSTTKDNLQCKKGDIVVSNDGYLYQCDDSRWSKIDENKITDCKDTSDFHTGLKNTYSLVKGKNAKHVYLYQTTSGSGKVTPNCKMQHNFILQVLGTDYYTCQNELMMNDCAHDRVVFGYDGKLYKCTAQGWIQETSIPDCSQNSSIKRTEQQYDNSITYNYNKVKSNNCSEAIKDYCKDSGQNNTNTDTNTEPVFTQDEQPTITNTDSQKNCTDTDGTGLDENGKCICDPDEHLVEYKYEGKYSICRCMDGYHRVGEPDENGKYAATGECIYAPETQTKIERDDMAMQRDAEDAYRNEYDNAQSWANKGTTALSTLMTGEGAMKAAQAIAEQKADKKAEEQMAEWISKMGCEYGNSQPVDLGKEETLPGGNELTQYYAEYKQLADKLKATKTALNLRPGIEAEVLYDRAETGLYQYANAERQSGGFTSLSRALMNPEGTDAEQWNAQKAEVAKDLTTGTLLTAGGLVVGAAGNYLVNRNHEPTKLQQSIDKVVVEVEEKLPAFTYTPAPVNITYQEPKTEIYLGENGGRAPIPTLSELEPKQNALTLNGDTTFDRNKATLKDTTKINAFVDRLNTEVLATMTTNQEISINIIGHTDRTGNDKINIPLSLERAQSVEKYIKGRISFSDSLNQIHYESTGVGSKECSTSYCDGKDDCELCRKVVVTIEDITKTQE